MSERPEPQDFRKESSLHALLRDMPGVLLAFSGGVDSSYLLHAALKANGPERVSAVIGVSPSVPASQLTRAHEVARSLGVPVVEVATHEIESPGYVQNAGDRCYFCKDTLFRTMRELPNPHGWTIVDGTNADDLLGHRPGRAAALEAGVRSPLAEVSLDKAAIRRLSRGAGLITADLPSAPCLASRIPAGTPVSLSALERIERAETFMRELGFAEFRVRDHGELARVEIPKDAFARVLTGDLAAPIARALHDIGYRFVSLDLDGFRSGSGSVV